MRSRKAALTAAVLAALLGTVAACGSAEDDYCEVLAGEQEELTGLAARGSGDVLDPTLQSFRRLRDAAPDDLRDEWDTLVGAYDVLAGTIDDLGIDPADYDSEAPPEDVTPDERRRLEAAASALQSARVTDAATGIEDHASSVCKVDFTG